MSYTKQNFKDGSILTAAQMNHIEEGIVEAEKAGSSDTISTTAKNLIVTLFEGAANGNTTMQTQLDALKTECSRCRRQSSLLKTQRSWIPASSCLNRQKVQRTTPSSFPRDRTLQQMPVRPINTVCCTAWTRPTRAPVSLLPVMVAGMLSM